MTRLLVSVRSAAEARSALAGGADIVDVKEPLRGALGRADAETIRAVGVEVGTLLPLSAALGELLHDAAYRSTSALGGANENADASRLSESLSGFRYAKFGLAGCAAHAHWGDRWQAALARLPRGIGPVAVAYADWRGADAPPPAEVLRVGASLGCCGLLLDTCHKAAGDLFRSLSHGEAAALVAVAHRAGMFVAVGGSLSLETTAQALETGADIIAVRGAVCRGGRDADVDVKLVRSLAAHVKRSTAAIPHGAQLDA